MICAWNPFGLFTPAHSHWCSETKRKKEANISPSLILFKGSDIVNLISRHERKFLMFLIY